MGANARICFLRFVWAKPLQGMTRYVIDLRNGRWGVARMGEGDLELEITNIMTREQAQRLADDLNKKHPPLRHLRD
jgi:hypothetical protein